MIFFENNIMLNNSDLTVPGKKLSKKNAKIFGHVKKSS